VGAPEKTAGVLGIEPGAPSLLVRRRYFAASEQPFEVSLTLHPGDRYVYTARLARGRRGVKPDV
jgi:DNA-binding GntR family transcriptional regulator